MGLHYSMTGRSNSSAAVLAKTITSRVTCLTSGIDCEWVYFKVYRSRNTSITIFVPYNVCLLFAAMSSVIQVEVTDILSYPVVSVGPALETAAELNHDKDGRQRQKCRDKDMV